MIHFLAPPSENTVTGGYIYNLNIARHLQNTLRYDFVRQDMLSNLHKGTSKNLRLGIARCEKPPSCMDLYSAAVIKRWVFRSTPKVLTTPSSVILDSLYLVSTEPPPHVEIPLLLMMHYIPSLQPTLSLQTRRMLEDREEAWFENASGYIVPSAYLCEKLAQRGVDPNRIAVCRPGVDERFFSGGRAARSGPITGHRTSTATGKRPTLLTVANITPVKGYIELLEVLCGLADLDWSWHIAGRRDLDQDYALAFFEKVRESPVADRVHYVGSTTVAQTTNLMREADLFILASQFEAFGMVLSEARAIDLPIVTNKVGGAVEAAGESAVFCTPGDTASWRAALVPLIENTRRLHELSAEMRNDKPPRSWEQAALEFLDHVHCLTGTPRNQDDQSKPAG